MLATPEFWVAISFVGFVALIIYFGAPKMIAKALDDRADRIRAELEEARRLREEAQNLLAEYQRKQRDAEAEADAIVTQARHEAELFAADARTKLKESLQRRMKLAEDKIAQAEAQAIHDVRARAADVAVAAAERLIASELSKDKARGLIDNGIKGLASKLN
jgi:F-type H+-transporting ATPase subunit b